MRSINWIEYSPLSLFFCLTMSFITLVHHLHSGLILHPGSDAFHVVWIEVFLIPPIVVSMIVFLRSGNRIAFWLYLFIAFLGFVFVGLFEGGWNHTAKLIAYLRIDHPEVKMVEILPPDNLHLWFYEVTGVATFISAMLASWFSWKFYRSVSNSDDWLGSS